MGCERIGRLRGVEGDARRGEKEGAARVSAVPLLCKN